MSAREYTIGHLRAVEFFSCAGGMAEGFRRAGIEFETAYDKSPDACASYAHNLGRVPVQEDLHDLFVRVHEQGFSPGPLDLLVADPPCTPWSRAGKRRGMKDERDCLEVTRDLILAWRPRAYLIGNVPGLDDARNRPTVQALFAPLRAAGYCIVDFARLNAANYGVPQRRIRPFWFGHLDGPCLTWPRPTHGGPRALASEGLFVSERLEPWVTVRQALAALPRAEWGEPLREYRVHKGHAPSQPDAPSHAVTGKQGSVGAGVLALPGDDRKHPVNQPGAPAHTITASDGGGGSRVLAWPWDRPATTVACDPRIAPPGHHGGTGYHSSPNAIRLSERAAAVLQGFPRSWVFCGASRRARWRQIGQAMPPPLAEAVARSIRDWFASVGDARTCAPHASEWGGVAGTRSIRDGLAHVGHDRRCVARAAREDDHEQLAFTWSWWQ